MQTCIIEIAYGAVAVEPSNRKPPDGLTCSVLEKVFRPVYSLYYRWKRRSIIFVGKFSRRKCSCVDDNTCYTHALQFSPWVAWNPYPNVIRPYHLKIGQNPYWIRTIRTMWHVCNIITGQQALEVKLDLVNKQQGWHRTIKEDSGLCVWTINSGNSWN